MGGQTREGQAGQAEQGGAPEEAGGAGAHPARQRLLDAVVAHFTAEGLADQSRRRIAEAIGTSHRMVLYHFGSKDGLLLAVVREVEARTQGRLAALSEDTPGEADALIHRMGDCLATRIWATSSACSSPSTGGALQGDDAIRPLLDEDVAHWLDANVALSARWGCRQTRGPMRASGWR